MTATGGFMMKSAILRYFILLGILSASAISCSAAVRIMPLGDSITEGISGSSNDTGYRRTLYRQLTSAGFDVDFVGSCAHGTVTDFDRDHEGHGGWRANQIRDYIPTWLNDNPADIILLHIGTNDIWHDEQAPSEIAAEINDILNNIDTFETENNTHITVVLAQIINRSPDSPAQALADTASLNTEIANLCTSRAANGDDLVLIDMYNTLTYPDDLADSAHPNDYGYMKMANKWFDCLEPIMKNSIYNVSLQADSYMQTSNDNLICSYTFGSNSSKAATSWYKNDSPVMNLYLPIEGSSQTALKDYSGASCVECTIVGDSVSEASINHHNSGKALLLRGSGSIYAGESFPINSSYTKTAWIYSLGSTGHIISGDSSTSSHTFGTPNNILSAGHNGVFDCVKDSEAITTATWHFVAVSYDSATQEMALYKDGSLVDTAIVTDAVTDTTTLLGSYNYNDPWNGGIDDVRIYNTALSPEQITAMYDNGNYNINIIVSQETSDNDIWHAVVTPFFTDTVGTEITTNAITIQPINEVTVESLQLSSSTGNNYSSESLLCSYTLPEGYTTAATSWYRNNSQIMNMYFPMEGGADWASVDFSGLKAKGTTYGSIAWSATAGHDGHGAYIFDGVNDYILANNNFPTGSSYTKAAWVYRTSNSGNNNIISGFESTGGHAFWAPESAGNKLSAGQNNSWYIVQDSQAMALNTWYYVAVTYNASNGEMVLYKNGAIVDSATASNTITDNTTLIGSHHNVSFWSGTIDDARVYNIALSSEQIAQLYTDGNAIAPSETSYGDIWQTEVTPFSDSSAGTETLSPAIMINPKVEGYVKDILAKPVAGATITIAENGKETTTDSNGYYNIPAPYNFTGTISAVKADYSFYSPQYSTPVKTDQTVNFTGKLNADLDTNGTVSISDLQILCSNWLETGTITTGDINNNGYIDLLDISELSKYWQNQ